MNHELDWLTWFCTMAENVGMPEGDCLLVTDAFLETILPLRYATRIDGSPWPAPRPGN